MSEGVDLVLAQRRARAGRARRVLGLVAAALLHLAVAAGAVLGPNLFDEPPRPLTYVPVQLVPAPALGRPDPPAQRPRPRPPEPAQTPAPAASTPPPAPAEPAPDPEPALSALRQPAEPQPPAPEPEPARTAPPGPPGPRGAPGGNPESPFTASGGTVDNPSFTYGYYLDRMVLLIRGQWVRPQLGSGPEAVVHFRVQRDGSVRNVELVSSSGYNSFDLSAMRAVQAAAPLPPLPRSYREGELGVTLIFR